MTHINPITNSKNEKDTIIVQVKAVNRMFSIDKKSIVVTSLSQAFRFVFTIPSRLAIS